MAEGPIFAIVRKSDTATNVDNKKINKKKDVFYGLDYAKDYGLCPVVACKVF